MTDSIINSIPSDVFLKKEISAGDYKDIYKNLAALQQAINNTLVSIESNELPVTTNKTINCSVPQTGISIVNDGSTADLTFTVNGNSYTVKPTDPKYIGENFGTFQTFTIATTMPCRVRTRGSVKATITAV